MNQEELTKFKLEQNLNRIVALKNRLDVLLVSLAISTAFAFFYNNCEFGHAEIFGLDIRHKDPYYHYSIAALLILIFGIVGSHLIEYVVKRSEYDKITLELYRRNISIETIPNSFYEYLYNLKPWKENDKPQEVGLFCMLILFYLSHFIAVIHILGILIENLISAIFMLALIIPIIILLYYSFVTSVIKYAGNLKNEVLYRIIRYLIPSVIAVIICIWSNSDKVFNLNEKIKNKDDSQIELRIFKADELKESFEFQLKE